MLGLVGTSGVCRDLKEEAVSAEPISGKALTQEDTVQRARDSAVEALHSRRRNCHRGADAGGVRCHLSLQPRREYAVPLSTLDLD